MIVGCSDGDILVSLACLDTTSKNDFVALSQSMFTSLKFFMPKSGIGIGLLSPFSLFNSGLDDCAKVPPIALMYGWPDLSTSKSVPLYNGAAGSAVLIRSATLRGKVPLFTALSIPLAVRVDNV